MIRKIFIKTIDFTIDNLEKTKLKIKKIDKQKLKKKFLFIFQKGIQYTRIPLPLFKTLDRDTIASQY